MRTAGLDVDSVDIEAFCSYRSLVEANRGINLDAETIALMDIGYASTKVSVVSRGSFAMTRTISQGGHVLTDALQKYFRLAYEDAEEGKAQLDVRQLLEEGKPTENPPLRVIQPHLDDLIRETRRSLNYYQSQQSELGTDPVGWVLLTGGGAKLQGIAEYMAAKLDLPVYSAGIFDNPRFANASETDFGPGAELSVVTGLAMRTHVKAA
jgi:type IV pilus assembly protein PilM